MKKQPILQQRLLDRIEAIVSDDASEDMEIKAAFPGRVTKKDYREATEKLGEIFKLTHAHNPTHSCYHVHDDWRKLL